MRIGPKKVTYAAGEQINVDEIINTVEAIEEPDSLFLGHEATINALWRWAKERPEDLRQVLRISRDPETDLHYVQNNPPANRPVGELTEELRATEEEYYYELEQIDNRKQ